MRTDISEYLYHWVKGSELQAFDTLTKIAYERRIISKNGFVRGKHDCICFTESPLAQFHKQDNSRYQPFGVMFHKNWIFRKGGRPVIYQPDSEYDLLPESHKWRHMRYEPPAIDFTWEREWRINEKVLEIDPFSIFFVVPSEEYGDSLSTEYFENGYRTVVSAEPVDLLSRSKQSPRPFKYIVIKHDYL